MPKNVYKYLFISLVNSRTMIINEASVLKSLHFQRCILIVNKIGFILCVS